MSFVVTLANITQIMEALIPSTSGIGYRSATLTGDPRCAALFSGAQFAVTDPDAKFPESGFVLGTGQAIELIGQSGTENSHPFNTTGDEDFNPTSGSSHDACSISFEFQCSPDFGGDVVVGYSFASDEYREQVDAFTGFADRFGLLLNGDNVALVPGTNEDVSVYSVNHINNTQYFHYNNPRPGQRTYPGFEPDGFTKCLNATGPTNPGWNTMKIGIVDINDLHFDSWVFLQEAGFTCNPDLSITNSPTPAPTNTPTTATPTETPTPAPTILIAETPGAGGDPHFITFDKQFFSYHGQCDLVLTRSQSLGLDVHVRTTRVNNPHMDYSYISGAAMQIRSDIFEVDEKGDLLINGETSTLSAGMVFEGLQSLSKTYRGKNQRIIVYDFDLGNDNKIQIRVNTKSGMLFVDVNGAFEDSEGLLGAAPEQSAASLLARDGETDLSSHWNSYGEEWQVNDSDPKLFQDKTRHPQFPATCEYKADRKNTFMRGSRRHLLETERVSVEAATKACAHLTSVKREFCVDDVMATGDLELVEDPFYGN